jgi:phosphonate transport system substrate-binding protein
MFKMLHIAGVIAVLLTGLPGCDAGGPSQKINLEKKEPLAKRSGQQRENTLRVAVGGMITPKAGYGYYRQFLDYIGEQLNLHIEFVDRDNYAEINRLVKTGGVDVAFVCGGPYVEGHDEFGMELLAAPQASGGTVYYSYIIVRADSPLARFSELRGKIFAFTDPLSNTGALVPTYMLAKMKETPESFFRKLVYVQSHDRAIMAVAEGLVDGAAVDSLIWEYLNKTDPGFTSKTRVLEKSPPFGIPPVVTRRDLDPRIKMKLRDVFLNAHKDEKGGAILRGMMIERFVPIEDSAYDSIRQMKRRIARHAGSEEGN